MNMDSNQIDLKKNMVLKYIVFNEPERKKETLLVVDDEKSITELCKLFFGNLGYIVLTANTPDDAIRLARDLNEKIHLLITDIRMPQMNGLELAELLRSIKPDMKCIFMSGYSVELFSNPDLLNEETNFLQKPFTLNVLAEKVRNILNQ